MDPTGDAWGGVATRQVPARTIASIREQVHQHEVSDLIVRSFAQLFEFTDLFPGLRSPTTTPESPSYAMYWGTFGHDAPTWVEVCLVIDRPVVPRGDIGVRVEPAHAEAYLPLTRRRLALPALAAAYADLGQWVSRHGRMVRDAPPREVYIADVMLAGDDDLVGSVAMPYTPRFSGPPHTA